MTQILTHGQNTTQVHMRDYISSRAHGYKGNIGYMSLKGYCRIKGEQGLTQDGAHGHTGVYMEAHGHMENYMHRATPNNSKIRTIEQKGQDPQFLK